MPAWNVRGTWLVCICEGAVERMRHAHVRVRAPHRSPPPGRAHWPHEYLSEHFIMSTHIRLAPLPHHDYTCCSFGGAFYFPAHQHAARASSAVAWSLPPGPPQLAFSGGSQGPRDGFNGLICRPPFSRFQTEDKLAFFLFFFLLVFA